MYLGFPEECDKCPECNSGLLEYQQVEGCRCHIHPPCSACVNNPLTCTACGWEDESPDYKYVSVAPGLFMREDKPRKLDNTKIDYRSKMHSGSSMIKEGVYPEGTSRQEVENIVKGTFGGKFEIFGNGRFKYIAYTD